MLIYRHGLYMISVDWLQCFCIGDLLSEGDYPIMGGTVTVTAEEGGTANFNKRFTVTQNGLQVATVLQLPKMKTMERGMTEVKLHNRVLYTSSPFRHMVNILKGLSLEYRGISRLDLCCDCNTLAGGRSVEDLIASFVHLGVGEYGHIVRKGSARYILHGNNHRKAHIKHESIKFGTVNSDVIPYIYNKSLELMTVKDKPWIRDCWKQAGLVHLIDEEGLNRLSAKELAYKLSDEGVSEYVRSGVWRFELSIKAHGKDILNMATGEIFKLCLDNISTAEKVEALFKMYAEKYFSFSECTGQKSIRHYKPVTLWEFSNECYCRPISIPRTGDTGRFDAMVVNYLNKKMREYSDLSSPILCGLQDAKEFINTIAGAKLYKCRAKRYEDYLSSLMGDKYFEQLMEEVSKIPSQLTEAKDAYREFLGYISEQSR